jgi:hypothetical protein
MYSSSGGGGGGGRLGTSVIISDSFERGAIGGGGRLSDLAATPGGVGGGMPLTLMTRGCASAGRTGEREFALP